MQIVTVDIGSYSVKILTSKMDRGNLTHLTKHEVILNQDQENTESEFPIWNQQQQIVATFLDDLQDDYYLISNAPSELFTTRFINLPIKNSKKAQQMIPFKLEEDIPYSLFDAHICSTLRPENGENRATVNVAQKGDFASYYSTLKRYEHIPRILTTEVSVFQLFVEKNQDLFPSSFAIIDIGHNQTKAYYYNDWQLSSTHQSFVAGSGIDEIISETYSISREDAQIYKHQNAFLLTSDQYEKVNHDQATFGKIMEQTLHPLVNEIKRWELGHRISHGARVKEIYLTGGTSSLKNLPQFLAQEFGVPVKLLDVLTKKDFGNIQISSSSLATFTVSHLLSQSIKFKSKTINVLTGDFRPANVEEIPLYSLAFWGTRVATLTVLLIFSIMLERFFILKDISILNTHIQSLVKNPTLKLNNRQKRLVLTDPATLEKKLNKDKNIISQEISTLQAAIDTNSVGALVEIANLLKGNRAEIINFNAISGQEFKAIIKAQAPQNVDALIQDLETLEIKDLFVEKNKDETITLSGAINL